MNKLDEHQSENAALIDALGKYFQAQKLTVEPPADGKVPILLLPNSNGGIEPKSVKNLLDEYLPHPERREGRAVMKDAESFIAHVNRFKSLDTVIFADPNREQPALTAVIDYHKAGFAGEPAFCKHTTYYDFPFSDEWKAWKKVNNEYRSQREFAEFIEDRLADIAAGIDPEKDSPNVRDYAAKLGSRVAGPHDMVELSRGLSVTENIRVKNAVRLDSGETEMHFETTHTDSSGAPILVPNLFIIVIPILLNGPAYRIPIRLRYRREDGTVKWSFQMYRPDVFFDDAYRQVCQDVATATALPVLQGAPEKK